MSSLAANETYRQLLTSHGLAGSMGRKGKWLAEGLQDGSLGFCGEESAGATFMRRNGPSGQPTRVASFRRYCRQIMAKLGKDPGEVYRDLTNDLGEPVADRIRPSRPRHKRTSCRSFHPSRSRRRPWPKSRSSRCSAGHPAAMPKSNSLKVATAGLPRARQAPKIYTRFPERVFGARITCTPSWPRRRRSSTMRSGQPTKTEPAAPANFPRRCSPE